MSVEREGVERESWVPAGLEPRIRKPVSEGENGATATEDESWTPMRRREPPTPADEPPTTADEPPTTTERPVARTPPVVIADLKRRCGV